MRELIVDLFAGGGGASEGIEQALGVTVDFDCLENFFGGSIVNKLVDNKEL